MKVRHTNRSAGLLAILAAIIPFVDWYVFHNLNKDFVAHSRDEKILLMYLNDGVKDYGVGMTRHPDEFKTVPNRSTFLYIVLSIVTLGIFELYWIYTLTVDPNEHFKSHGVFDEEIIRVFENLTSTQQPPGTVETGEPLV
jgi:hypothetical protein